MKSLLIALSLLLSLSVHADIVVVVSKSSLVERLDGQDIANIFLSRTNRFPSGEKSSPVELKEQGIKSTFYSMISGKSPKQLSAYWATLVFTGKGRPPRKYGDIESLIKDIENNPNKITYLDESQVTDGMKVVYKLR